MWRYYTGIFLGPMLAYSAYRFWYNLKKHGFIKIKQEGERAFKVSSIIASIFLGLGMGDAIYTSQYFTTDKVFWLIVGFTVLLIVFNVVVILYSNFTRKKLSIIKS